MKNTKFECWSNDRTGPDGGLAAVTVYWNERTQMNRLLQWRALCSVGFVVVMFGLAWLFSELRMDGQFFIWAGLLTLLWAGWLCFSPAPERELTFFKDWSIECERGLKHYPRVKRWGRYSYDILSIEVWRNRTLPADDIRHEVVMLMYDGDIVHVAADLHEHHATKVARQLTHALSRIREIQDDAVEYSD